jgi:hypothetical protein
MQLRQLWRVAWVFPVGLLTGCPKNRSDNIVINETKAAITVEFRLRHPEDRGHNPNVCGLARYGNRLAPVAKEWSQSALFLPPISWTPVPNQQQNLGDCSLQAIVPPGHGFLVVSEEWCADYRDEATARGLDQNGIRPYLLELSVITASEKLSYRDWEAATVFVRQKSGHCIFHVK